jgi:hypothetical protein
MSTRKPAAHPMQDDDFESALQAHGLKAKAPHGRAPNPRRQANEFPFDALTGPNERNDGVIGRNPQWDPSRPNNPAWRGYDHGLLPTNSLRANVTANTTTGVVAIAGHDGNGQISPPNMGPGVWVVCGQASGYQVAASGGGADPYFDLSCGSIIRSNMALAFRINPNQGTPPDDLNLAFFPVKKVSEEDFRLASAQAKAFAGIPLLQYPPGSSPSSQSTPFSFGLASPTTPGPSVAFFPHALGNAAASTVDVISNATNDATGNGSVFLANTSANAAGAALDFFFGNAPGTTGSGIQMGPGGTFGWTGPLFLCSGEANSGGSAGAIQYVSGVINT